jgi:hypothetical protein
MEYLEESGNESVFSSVGSEDGGNDKEQERRIPRPCGAHESKKISRKPNSAANDWDSL